MTTRRQGLQAAGALLATLTAGGWQRAFAGQGRQRTLITRAIPGRDERLPVIGLGSSASFARLAQDEPAAVGALLDRLLELGASVFDTAPSYGVAEEVAGRSARELGIASRLFWATKLNVAARGGSADPAAARAQLEASFERIGKPVIDLVQVHNMGDVRTQLPILRELKEAGRIRYIGLTTTFDGQYAELVETMAREPVDFIGTDYAIDNRQAEQTILPLARDRGIGVLIYAPFGRTRLWRRVAGQELPAWAREFDAQSWAQFFLKFVASHPAVTVVTPATSRLENLADNIGAAHGRLPDEEERQRMIALIDALPAA